jgi:hypothetical protein
MNPIKSMPNNYQYRWAYQFTFTIQKLFPGYKPQEPLGCTQAQRQTAKDIPTSLANRDRYITKITPRLI